LWEKGLDFGKFVILGVQDGERKGILGLNLVQLVEYVEKRLIQFYNDSILNVVFENKRLN
jgi:hypothetical protein